MDGVAECARKDRDFVITQESTSPLRACDARLSCSAPADPESHPPLEATIRRLYFNTIALAPMVRAGTLPLRALALSYGCDVVYSEEIIDRKLMQCVREENRALGTIDFVTTGNRKGDSGKESRRLVFQTVPQEKPRVVFQLGTRNPEWAVEAARLVQHDVAAIDLNMGCPKKFSIQDGMGAALLDNPATAVSLVKALRQALPHTPVSCKIRLLDASLPMTKTLAFARAVEEAGACALNVHLRTKEDKASDPARWELLRPLVAALAIPVIANGDVYRQEDVEQLLASSHCAGVMLARPVLYNPSLLRTLRFVSPSCGRPVPGNKSSEDALSSTGSSPRLPLLPLMDVIRTYLHLCSRYESHVSNAKYVVLEMIVRRRHPEYVRRHLAPLELPESINVASVSKAKTLQALGTLFGIEAGASSGLEGVHLCLDSYFDAEQLEGTNSVVKGRDGEPRANASEELGEGKRRKIRDVQFSRADCEIPGMQ